MSALILVSSFGILLDIHYCGDNIKSIGFFSDAPSCEMQQVNCASEEGCDHNTLYKSSCCSDDLLFNTLDPEVDQASSSQSIVWINAELLPNLTTYVGSEWNKPSEKSDKVPRSRELHIMHCQFLI